MATKKKSAPKHTAKAQVKAEKPLAHQKSDKLEALLLQVCFILAMVIVTIMIFATKVSSQALILAVVWVGIMCMAMINALRM